MRALLMTILVAEYRGPVCVEEGGRGGEVLRHHLQRALPGRGYTAQGQSWQTLWTEENLQSGESSGVLTNRMYRENFITAVNRESQI